MLDPFVIPGAVLADERQLPQIVERYGANQTFMIYCSCPNEVSAAWMAKRLRLAGVKLALPLIGGIDARRVAGFDVEPIRAMSDTAMSGKERENISRIDDSCVHKANAAHERHRNCAVIPPPGAATATATPTH